MRENPAQNAIRKRASELNNWLWRNNNGASKTEDGRMVRFGLGNDSPQINRVFKSSDLIGITPRLITADDVGKVLGVFTAVEVKRPDWRYSNTPREQAQWAFLTTVATAGGLAGFARSEDDYLEILRGAQ